MGALAKEPHSDRAQAAALVAAGSTDEEIAELIGVHRTTVCRWRQDAGFMEHVRDERASLIRGLRGRLVNSVGKAIDVLVRLAESAQDEEIQLKAATAIIEQGLPKETVGTLNGSVHLHQHQHIDPEQAKRRVRELRGKVTSE